VQGDDHGEEATGDGIGTTEKEASVWFAGDTGYQTSEGPCPVFKGQLPLSIGFRLLIRFLEIGSIHGPFDLALIPIWRGASLSFIGKLGYRVCFTNLHLQA